MTKNNECLFLRQTVLKRHDLDMLKLDKLLDIFKIYISVDFRILRCGRVTVVDIFYANMSFPISSFRSLTLFRFLFNKIFSYSTFYLLIKDPDSLNQIFLSLFDRGALPHEENTPKESSEHCIFLKDVHDSEYATTNSLLSLRLNELAKDPRLLQLFDQYLRDINGPTYLLDCFLQIRDIQICIQSV